VTRIGGDAYDLQLLQFLKRSGGIQVRVHGAYEGRESLWVVLAQGQFSSNSGLVGPIGGSGPGTRDDAQCKHTLIASSGAQTPLGLVAVMLRAGALDALDNDRLRNAGRSEQPNDGPDGSIRKDTLVAVVSSRQVITTLYGCVGRQALMLNL
jgi:hypothetical protein